MSGTCHNVTHASVRQLATGNHKRRTRPIKLPCHQDASVCVDLLIVAATYEDHIGAVLILAQPLQILNQLWKPGQSRVTVWCTCAHRTAGNPSPSHSLPLCFCVLQSLFFCCCLFCSACANIFLCFVYVFTSTFRADRFGSVAKVPEESRTGFC